MKNIYVIRLSLFLITLLIAGSLSAQVLSGVKARIQQEDEWCWAGCSASILDYYGHDSTSQCNIAEYTRSVATWHYYGSTPCCSDPNGPCNYSNYDSYYNGSISDIVMHFKSIATNYIPDILPLDSITTRVNSGRPIVIRWGWSSGGGHFVVGYGVNANNLYIMNPWFGEGHIIEDYDWTVHGVGMDTYGNSYELSTHDWTETLDFLTVPTFTGLNNLTKTENARIYPNPANDFIKLDGWLQNKEVKVEITDMLGRTCLVKEITTDGAGATTLSTDGLNRGIYMIKITSPGSDAVMMQKLMLL